MYVNLGGRKIYYQKIGKGKDLILLHGWKHDVSAWWGIVDKLKDDFTLWLVDLPGHGRSELGDHDLTLDDFADTIVEFISNLKLPHPHLLGHSFGGNVAIRLAARNGSLIDRLILIGSSGIRTKPLRKDLLRIGAKIYNFSIPSIFGIKDLLRRFFYRQIEGDYLQAGNLRGTIQNIFKSDIRNDLPKIKNETLLLWGEKDRAVPLQKARLMYKLIPNSRIEIIENAGHNVHLHQGERVVYWVKNFLLE